MEGEAEGKEGFRDRERTSELDGRERPAGYKGSEKVNRRLMYDRRRIGNQRGEFPIEVVVREADGTYYSARPGIRSQRGSGNHESDH